MRGARAKQLRKLIYGDDSTHPRGTRYAYHPRDGSIRCIGNRAKYRALKRAIIRRIP